MSQAFVLSGKITMDAKAAVAGLDATTAALGETKAAVAGFGQGANSLNNDLQVASTAMQQMIEAATGVREATELSAAEMLVYGEELDRIRARYNPLFAASRAYELELREIAAAEQLGALSANEATQARERAALAMTPMTAQARALGVEMSRSFALGGNQAKMLAMQLSQVGQQAMAGGGFIRALAIQLPDIGLAFGTVGTAVGLLAGIALPALVSAFRDAGDAELTAEAQIKNLTGALDAYNSYTEIAKKTTKELNAEFGSSAETLRNFSRYLADVSVGRALDALATEGNPLLGELRDAVTAVHELDAATQRSASLISGWGGATSEQILTAKEALGGFQDSVDDAAAKLGMLPEQAVAISAAFDRLSTAQSMTEIRDRAAEVLTEIQQFFPEGARLPPKLAEVAELLNEIAAKAARGVASAEELAALDIAGGIRSAADEARRLADELLAAVGAAQSLASQGGAALRDAKLRFEFRDDPVRLAAELAGAQFDARTRIPQNADPTIKAVIEANRRQAVADAAEIARSNAALAEWQRNQRSAAGGTEKQRSALADLIDAQMQELAILRETDPVQKEMLKHREALAGATDAERQMVEELIAAHIREQAQMQALQETQDFFTGTLYDAFEGLILRGDSLTEVLHNIVSALARAALQATLLGTGPLAGLFGTSGGGGLLTMLFKAVVPGKAEGGMITGPGSGTSDDVLIAASSGEFVMTAAATRRHRHLLEAMNAGAHIPGFARGGAVGGQARGGGAAAAEAAPANITIDLRGARGNAEIEALVATGIRRGLAEYDRSALPLRVRQISSDTRRIG
ncbi:MAG: hypothetical protein CVT82_00310 [Alphaproteobacteria bacterium HGW-Alphaproteobacteria-4]|nr:MAG: hypothetical protein CVT82_00310 [Alphaproteobacteria bacterium HGW-Alphaproteobacteria-4]